MKKLRGLKIIEPFLKSERCFLILSNLIQGKYFIVNIAYFRERFKIEIVASGALNANYLLKLDTITSSIVDYIVIFKREKFNENDLKISNKIKKPILFFNKLQSKVFFYRDIFFKSDNDINLTFFNGRFYLTLNSKFCSLKYTEELSNLIRLNNRKMYLVCYEGDVEYLKQKIAKALKIQVDITKNDLLKAVDIAIQATALLEGLFSNAFILYVPEEYE